MTQVRCTDLQHQNPFNLCPEMTVGLQIPSTLGIQHTNIRRTYHISDIPLSTKSLNSEIRIIKIRSKLNLAFLKCSRQKIIISKLERSNQGNNARKVISEVYAFFVLCGRKSKHKTVSQPDMESIFTKIIYEIFWS